MVTGTADAFFEKINYYLALAAVLYSMIPTIGFIRQRMKTVTVIKMLTAVGKGFKATLDELDDDSHDKMTDPVKKIAKELGVAEQLKKFTDKL